MVSFALREDTERAVAELNGKAQLDGKTLVVDFAILPGEGKTRGRLGSETEKPNRERSVYPYMYRYDDHAAAAAAAAPFFFFFRSILRRFIRHHVQE